MTSQQTYLMLDFDGVMNSRNWAKQRFEETGNHQHMLEELDREAVQRVNRIVEALDAQVIISSSWRRGKTMEWLQDFLKANGFAYPERVIGMTPMRLSYQPRGHEIQSWMDDHGVTAEQIVILDDESDMEHLLPRLIQTTWQHGLQDEHVAQAIALFQRQELSA